MLNDLLPEGWKRKYNKNQVETRVNTLSNIILYIKELQAKAAHQVTTTVVKQQQQIAELHEELAGKQMVIEFLKDHLKQQQNNTTRGHQESSTENFSMSPNSVLLSEVTSPHFTELAGTDEDLCISNPTLGQDHLQQSQWHIQENQLPNHQPDDRIPNSTEKQVQKTD